MIAAATGIGFETARGLAEMGAHVVMACRTEARGRAAADEIIRATGNKNVEVMVLDLSSFGSVRDFVSMFKRKGFNGLHVLVNNAGCMMPSRSDSKDGIEMCMQSNHLGHFLLTGLLLDELKRVDQGRVVNVASALHRKPRAFDFEGMVSPKAYSMFPVYSQTKLANVLFTLELQRRLSGTSVTANCLHPGNVLTEVTRNLPAWINFIHGNMIYYLELPFMKTMPMGAYTSLHVATSPDLRGVGGQYFVHCAAQTPSEAALDRTSARRLWDFSAKLVGLDFPAS
jgi:NAD(P)-dependent dehydrogenase (short-subunit alcohol dehydrogenase family)